MPPRIHPDRALTNREKQARRYARTKEDRAYVAALEAALVEIENHMNDAGDWWRTRHAATIARARAARGTAATTTED